MKIVNPLYDTAFKYLMENNRLAKKVLSVILDTEVVELSLGQQETIAKDEKRMLALFRLDFKAVIKDSNGERKKVLIELQKSKYPTDIQRFRNYLGSNYMTKDESDKTFFVAEDQAEYKTSLPIVAIYILGYNLDDLPYMAVTANHDIINSVSKKKIKVKSFFIDHLTHQAHVLQVLRLPEKRRTRLEKFMVFFNQAWCTNDKFILDLQDIPEEFNDIAKYLQSPVMDEKFHRQLVAEEEIDTIFDDQEAKYLRKIEKIEEEKEEERRQKEDERSQKEEERRLKEEERRLKEAARQKEQEALKKLAKQMKIFGSTIEEIMKETGLTKEEIGKLLD